MKSFVALVTGANRGIGYHTAQELSARGHRVYLGTRRADQSGEAVDALPGQATWLTLDVADTSSIRAAAAWLAEREPGLDVLINNAGIYPDEGVSILDLPREQLVATFQTNTFGPLEVVQAFLPLLRRSDAARIVNVSSGYGQLDGLSADVPSYCLSKLALNGATLMLADKLKPDRMAVNAVCPGWVRTDMGGPQATRSVAEGAAGIVWLAAEASPSLTGKFFRDGEELAW